MQDISFNDNIDFNDNIEFSRPVGHYTEQELERIYKGSESYDDCDDNMR